MAKKRPAAVTVMGILNLVFGSIMLLCFMCNGIQVVMQLGGNRPGALNDPNDPTTKMLDFMKAEIPGFMTVQVLSLAVHLILTLILLVSGVGLLNMKGWGRIGSIFYAVSSVLVEIASLIYQLVYVNPVMNRWLQGEFQRAKVPGMPDASFLSTLMNIGAVVGAVVLMTYAIILLIMMLLPKVSAAFAGTSSDVLSEERRDEDYYDEGYERRRREPDQ
jgi:hypothetical protein